MVTTQHIDSALLDKAIKNSGLRISHIVEQLGISRQGFNDKRKGRTPFRLSEVYVLCDLLKITSDELKEKIFFPK